MAFITRRLILIKLERQSNSFHGTGHLKIQMLIKWYFYLTEPSNISFQTIFHMKLSSVMTEIHLRLTVDSRS